MHAHNNKFVFRFLISAVVLIHSSPSKQWPFAATNFVAATDGVTSGI